MNQKTIIKTGIILYITTMAAPAYAYLDPGTGSIIIQAIIGTIVGGLAALRLYWEKVKTFFSRNKTKNEKEQAEQQHQEQHKD